MIKSLIVLLFVYSSVYAQVDLSGKYKCTGVDSKDGKYSGVVSLVLDKNHITKDATGYTFALIEHDAKYSGFGIFDGKSLAIYFANEKTEEHDYGIGVASIVNSKQFTKFYYEPKYGKNGSSGTEICQKI